MENSKKRKNIVGIASIPNRVEGLKDAIKCLSPQVDHIYVWLNGYKEIPNVVETNVTFHLSKENIGAIGKFLVKKYITEKNYNYFSCDDDILYPPNYIQTNLDQFEPNTIQSSHGGFYLKFPIESYYKEADFGRNIPLTFPQNISHKCVANITGTGVMMMDSTILNRIPFEKFMENYNSVDVLVSCWAQENNTKCYVINHPGNWLKENNKINQNNSIFKTSREKDQMQTKMMNDYFTKNKEELSNTRISFIIAAKDNFKYTKNIYLNLIENHPKEEIVIVSGDSKDETNKYFSKIKNKNLKFISLTNTNLSNNYNVGVKNSTNDIIVLIHNDMYIPTSFKNNFLQCLHKGCITTYTRVEPPIFPGLERGKEVKDFGNDLENFNKEEFEKFSENYNKIGIGGDKLFFGCYKQDYLNLDGDTFQMFCEDDDLHLRLFLNGKHKTISNACVYHFVSKTSRKNDTSLIEKESNINFIKKWGFRKSIFNVKYNKSFILKNPTSNLNEIINPWFNGGKDIIVEIDGQSFNQQDFQILQQLNDIIKDSGEIGEFKLGNLKITINSLQEYQNDLIKI